MYLEYMLVIEKADKNNAKELWKIRLKESARSFNIMYFVSSLIPCDSSIGRFLTSLLMLTIVILGLVLPSYFFQLVLNLLIQTFGMISHWIFYQLLF